MSAGLAKDVVLRCMDLTVLTPDRSRVLVGDITDPVTVANAAANAAARDVAHQARGVDLTVLQGDRLLVVGASGSGKSSLIRAIAG